MINTIIAAVSVGVLFGTLVGMGINHDKRINELEKSLNNMQCPKDYNNYIPGICSECEHQFNYCDQCGAPMNGFTCTDCGEGYRVCPICNRILQESDKTYFLDSGTGEAIPAEEWKRRQKQDDGMPF